MLRPNEEAQRKDIRNKILKDIQTVYPSEFRRGGVTVGVWQWVGSEWVGQ